MDAKYAFRRQVLEQFGARGTEIDELLTYNQNIFDHNALQSLRLPLDDEPFVAAWQTYAEEARTLGTFEALKTRLVQLRFPIQQGISQTEVYAQAVKKGILPPHVLQSQGLPLRHPESLELRIHQTPAGKIPVLIAGEREDFVALLQALTFRNEPEPVPPSQGAAMIAGYNNWDRIWTLKEAMIWEKGELYVNMFWSQEFQKILPQKHMYQDKFILVSPRYYSGVAPESLGLEEDMWKDLSVTIRLEHECTHYFTKRVLSSMQNKLLDELIADYAGITAAAGRFRADWFLTFLGLEHYPVYREGARLQNYRGTPPLSDRAFAILQALVYQAAHKLERYANACPAKQTVMVALTSMTLEELASDQSEALLREHQQLYEPFFHPNA
ncbi:hypothetical protein GF339_17600 [candidate division KSB3 bacterium]|uniref:Uncharacterized protein n=1 Tax=candidate division KSB3 bacterium TaxID=2044937 RepID=A0A9D5JYA5_9BACT|nr:hypothetical protein [candidate division KSB3 bacterium]MBD3326404.1 hypothetical protein [candidate division KSB3 bacterium]